MSEELDLHRDPPPDRQRRRLLAPLIWATGANYAWQVPYAVHQYGWHWVTLPGLSLALLATGVWFIVAVRSYAAGRPRGRLLLVGFLIVEAAFYLVHNVSGAFLGDLPLSNPVVLIASILGYLNLLLALLYLWLLRGRT